MADRSARLVTAGTALALLAWVATGAMGLLVLTQAFGIGGLPVLYVAQALTPVLLAPAVPLALASMLVGRHGLAVTNAGIAVGLLVLLAPVVFASAPDPPDGAARTRIAHANTYYRNEEHGAAAATLLAIDSDLLAITEYTFALAAELDARGVHDRYAHAVELPSFDASGVALFSRHPIELRSSHIGSRPGIEADVQLDGAAVRVLVIHPVPATKVDAMRRWSSDLADVGRRAEAADVPVVVVGDFNAARWHPEFRALLRRGLHDAHEQLGRGFTRSWPLGRRLPPFVRIDHALTGDGATAVDVDDVTVPGSDHRGFVVEVAISPGGAG